MTIAANGVDLFLPETYDIVWSLIILIIVALFFYKFFLPKFQSVFDERTAKIEGGLAKAEQAQKDAEEAKKKYQAQLSTARVEASKGEVGSLATSLASKILGSELQDSAVQTQMIDQMLADMENDESKK